MPATEKKEFLIKKTDLTPDEKKIVGTYTRLGEVWRQFGLFYYFMLAIIGFPGAAFLFPLGYLVKIIILSDMKNKINDKDFDDFVLYNLLNLILMFFGIGVIIFPILNYIAYKRLGLFMEKNIHQFPSEMVTELRENIQQIMKGSMLSYLFIGFYWLGKGNRGLGKIFLTYSSPVFPNRRGFKLE